MWIVTITLTTLSWSACYVHVSLMVISFAHFKPTIDLGLQLLVTWRGCVWRHRVAQQLMRNTCCCAIDIEASSLWFSFAVEKVCDVSSSWGRRGRDVSGGRVTWSLQESRSMQSSIRIFASCWLQLLAARMLASLFLWHVRDDGGAPRMLLGVCSGQLLLLAPANVSISCTQVFAAGLTSRCELNALRQRLRAAYVLWVFCVFSFEPLTRHWSARYGFALIF